MRDDQVKPLAAFRAELPVLERCVYLNTGTAGPTPLRADAAARAEMDRELADGRGNLATWGRFFRLLERCRQLVGRLLGVADDEVALTHHTSDGINTVLWGLPWRAGDELVTTTIEHDAGVVPLGLLRDRHGVVPRFADVGHGERALDGLRRQLGPRTRLVLLSHVSYATGATLPLQQMIELAHDAGALVLVDGAQTVGARPLDAHALDADFYTLSGQKWLLGPEGTGALFVKRSLIDHLRCTWASYFTPSRHDFRGNLELPDAARRYENGMVHRPSWAAFSAAAEWLLDEVGLDRAWRHGRALAARARAQLAALPGVELLTPPEMASQLLSFDIPALSPAQLFGLTTELGRRAAPPIVIRSTPHPPYCLRASFGFFNTEAEVDLLVAGIAEALDAGPRAIPLKGFAATLPDHR